MRKPRANYGSVPEVENILKTWGGDIAIARKRRRLSQQELADKVLVDRRSIMKVESGDPSVGVGVYMSTIWILGLHRKLENVLDPSRDSSGLHHDLGELPERVRRTEEDENAFKF